MEKGIIKMQLMKYSPLALLVAGLMNASGLAASEWNTVAARATAADGFEVRACQYRIATWHLVLHIPENRLSG